MKKTLLQNIRKSSSVELQKKFIDKMLENLGKIIEQK